MKQGKVYKGLLVGALGGCLLLAGCSGSQKPAALAPVGGSTTGTSGSCFRPGDAYGGWNELIGFGRFGDRRQSGGAGADEHRDLELGMDATTPPSPATPTSPRR